MNASAGALFGTVAPKDHLGLMDEGQPNYSRVAKFLDFRDKDVARAAGVAPSAIKGPKPPPEVLERVLEWIQAANLVAQFFSGDVGKTALWFKLPNPLLGGVEPREMIRIGRFDRLYMFIRDAIAEIGAPEKPTE